MTSPLILIRMRNISDKTCGEIKTHTVCSIFFFFKSCRLWGNVEKHGGARQATDNTTMRRLRFDCQINKARTQTLKIPITLLLEHCKNDCTIVPQYYLIIHHFFCFLFTGYITCLVFCLLVLLDRLWEPISPLSVDTQEKKKAAVIKK